METRDIRLRSDMRDSSLRIALTMQPVRLDPESQTRSGADIYCTRLTGKLSLETVPDSLCTMRSEPASICRVQPDQKPCYFVPRRRQQQADAPEGCCRPVKRAMSQ